MDVSLTPGESLDLKARWKQIQVPGVNRLVGTEFVTVRQHVEGADTKDWHNISAPLLQKSANGAIIYLPEATYSARLGQDRIIENRLTSTG
jgi:hypothetical protein